MILKVSQHQNVQNTERRATTDTDMTAGTTDMKAEAGAKSKGKAEAAAHAKDHQLKKGMTFNTYLAGFSMIFNFTTYLVGFSMIFNFTTDLAGFLYDCQY